MDRRRDSIFSGRPLFYSVQLPTHTNKLERNTRARAVHARVHGRAASIERSQTRFPLVWATTNKIWPYYSIGVPRAECEWIKLNNATWQKAGARAEYRASTTPGTATPTTPQININDARPSPDGTTEFIGYACRASNPIASSSFEIPRRDPVSHLDRPIFRADAFLPFCDARIAVQADYTLRVRLANKGTVMRLRVEWNRRISCSVFVRFSLSLGFLLWYCLSNIYIALLAKI